MKFFDDRGKKTKWWNRNYLYLGTFLIVLINVALFKFWGDSWESDLISLDRYSHWSDPLYFNYTIRTFLNSFSHANMQHVLLNMLCFAVCGVYLERKTGTLGIIGLVAFAAYISGIAISCNYTSAMWHGFSGVNYFLYAYVIFDFLFSFRSPKKNTANIILGLVIVIFIYVAMCFSGGVEGFCFEIYPYDLLYNSGHYAGFLAGMIISLFKNIVEVTTEHSAKI